jgi:AAA family ATP:ADP antiporter
MRIVELLRSDDPRYKGHLPVFLISYFLVLFNYPLIRAASTTMFLEEFGAKSSPVAWLWTVVILSLTILISNRFQKTHTVQKVFFLVAVVSSFIFVLGTFGYLEKIPYATYLSFIWKEICIVLQVHLLLAYANNFFHKNDFKFIIGPVGAVGSVGGILGGLLTTFLSRELGTTFVAWVGIILVFLPGLLFLKTPLLHKEEDNKTKSPLATLDSAAVRSYVFHLGLMVMLSQFIINIADFKFNLAFESAISDSHERTAYLGSVYTWTNFIGLLFQFIALPLLLPIIKERHLHIFIPVSYFMGLGLLSFTGGEALFATALFYIYLKASDYSLFSGGKELLYQCLRPEQKYGAKYLTDMLVYRFSKALIAAVLIYLHSSSILNVMMTIFLFSWLILVIRIFHMQKKIFL